MFGLLFVLSDRPQSLDGRLPLFDWRTGYPGPLDTGWTYIARSDSTFGNELWGRGPGETFHLLEDINPGSESSYPRSFTLAGDTLFFTANDGAAGREPWRINSDGQAEMVADLNPGPGSSDPRQLQTLDGTLFFSARTADDEARSLFRRSSDGAIDEVLYEGSAIESPRILFAFQDRLLVFSRDADAPFGSRPALLWVDESGETSPVFSWAWWRKDALPDGEGDSSDDAAESTAEADQLAAVELPLAAAAHGISDNPQWQDEAPVDADSELIEFAAESAPSVSPSDEYASGPQPLHAEASPDLPISSEIGDFWEDGYALPPAHPETSATWSGFFDL